MKKLGLITVLLCTVLTVFGQNPKNIIKLYGGLPTSNKNMSWKDAVKWAKSLTSAALKCAAT